jgi:xanthine dehydrogenase accessory factor
MPAPHGVIERLAELALEGRPFVLVTLVGVVGSAPQDVGSKMLVDADGLRFGTVGGGRVEQQAITRAQELLAEANPPACLLLEWNLQRDVGMTCGGVVTMLFEPQLVRSWRVVVFGAGHVAQAVIRCLLLLDCRVVCIDPRAEWLARLPQSPQLERLQVEEPRDWVPNLMPQDAVVCMTMGHRTDLPVLERILREDRRPWYLGVIGSAAKRRVLVRELADAGIPTMATEAIRCPIGLPLGGNQPGEIAVSVVAELLEQRGRGSCSESQAGDR